MSVETIPISHVLLVVLTSYSVSACGRAAFTSRTVTIIYGKVNPNAGLSRLIGRILWASNSRATEEKQSAERHATSKSAQCRYRRAAATSVGQNVSACKSLLFLLVNLVTISLHCSNYTARRHQGGYSLTHVVRTIRLPVYDR